MAAEISSIKKRKAPGFMTLLSSAACEWALIFLLFMDASLSYLATKFAQYCELKTPCVLCSRLDHVLGKKKPGGCWSLLCTDHREEISSLVSCSVHSNLADVHGICEGCLMPVAVQHKSNSEAYRLLVGKLWVDVERSVLQNSLPNKYIRLVPRTTCSCCMKTWRAKSNAERLIEPNPVSFGASKASAKPPLPRVPGRSRFSRRDSLKRLRDKFTRQTAPHPSESNGVDTLSLIGYAKLKNSSDSESEVPLSEDDDHDGNPGSCEKCDSKSEDDAYFSGKSQPKTPADYVASNNSTHQVFEVKHSIIDQPNLLNPNDLKNANSSSSDIFTEHGFRELDWAESHLKTSTCLTPELITLDNGHQPPDIGGGSSGLSAETLKSNASLPHVSGLSVLSELLSLYNVPSLGNTVTIPQETINVVGTSDNGNTVSTKHIELAGGSSDNALSSMSMNQTDPLNQSTENGELLGMLVVEPIPVCDSVETEEDVRSPQQISKSEVGLSLEDHSPRTHDQHDTSRKHENSGSQVFSASLVRNDSSYDSLDEINVSYIEGESTVDRLKRQVEHDRTCINSLNKELEEERNAAAVAVNQAMAMITRLQEEKASLHMEALQYLRMMEEQAEYDMEALERSNDLLSEKEKELQDLEAELEFYRNNSHDESALEDQHKETLKVENTVTAHVENSSSTSNDSISAKIMYSNGNSEYPNYEDERIYISQSLKKLEKKLCQVYCCRRVDAIPNSLNSGKIEIKVENLEDSNVEKLLNEDEGSNSLVQKMMLTSKVSPSQEGESNGTHSRDKSADFTRDCDFVGEKSDKSSLSTNTVEINPATLEKEIVELHDRLDALETDRDFLKHASNFLWNGKDGFQYIQEIAHQLQELRKVEFKKQSLSVA